MVTDIATNGVRVGVEDDGNITVRTDDAELRLLFTVTNVEHLHHALTMAEVWANVEGASR